ncbi:hypothetical protein HK097_003809 [Rhizophlyctis rosea]|uniref:Uncharacterized protein n=1 Tax=Rhizophlyctis rosea TaxID=64517 RepID=A0AAD5X0E3_9FUNG|nr:hypothetical protein HK097_003809 [Rhizophlyctis rosea]
MCNTLKSIKYRVTQFGESVKATDNEQYKKIIEMLSGVIDEVSIPGGTATVDGITAELNRVNLQYNELKKKNEETTSYLRRNLNIVKAHQKQITAFEKLLIQATKTRHHLMSVIENLKKDGKQSDHVASLFRTKWHEAEAAVDLLRLEVTLLGLEIQRLHRDQHGTEGLARGFDGEDEEVEGPEKEEVDKGEELCEGGKEGPAL